MSQEEAILKRKERFGGFQSDEAKKMARAQRFGGAVTDTDSGKVRNDNCKEEGGNNIKILFNYLPVYY